MWLTSLWMAACAASKNHLARVEAIEKAQRLVHDRDLELWCGERLVIRISHKAQ
jgi:hypothetical protein